MDLEVKDREYFSQRHPPVLRSKRNLKRGRYHSENGEFVGLIGPNGSGKSTLLKCIYRILKPNAGQVFLDEEELRAMSIKESARKWG